MPTACRGHGFAGFFAERLPSIRIDKFDHAHTRPWV
jgi:hypothetical protein